MKTKALALNLVMVVLALVVATAFTTGGNWKIPAEYKTKKNTVKSAPANIAVGKDLYLKKCKSCHAEDGKKNGDFTSAAFKGMTDGEIYYMSIVGNGKMPSFEKKITDETDRWSLVNYVRSMK